ncbi:MAG: hypothetical protein L3J41_05355 [Melioribacteraceae bacterium]|nr:hypothetical protein [Melioribacteraceae bacterium]
MRNKLYKVFLAVILISISYFFIFCDDGITNVEVIDSGLIGRVFDTTGNPISDVEIFCLYNLSYLPIPPLTMPKINLLNEKNEFDFELFQNYPNPFFSSTYIRYSLPQKCTVEIIIRYKNSNRNVYSFTRELPYGYYQHYLNSIVDSLNLENGLYIYNLKAIGEDNSVYNAEKEMMVISTEGEASAKTNNYGVFNFDFNKALVGDSVIVKSYDNNSYMRTKYLTNTVNFLFVKPGYKLKYLRKELFQDVLLTHDVVLLEED